MESKNITLKNTDSVCSNNAHEKFMQLFNESFKQHKVAIHEIIKMGKAKQKLGQFYRIEKTFFYKQRIIVLYLLNFLLYNSRSSSYQTKYQCKIIQNIFYRSIKEFEIHIQKECQSIRFQSVQWSEIEKLQKSKNKLVKLLETIKQQQNKNLFNFTYEQVEIFLDILVKKWTKTDNFTDGFLTDTMRIFGKELVIQQVGRENKITQLTICSRNSKEETEYKHLLYKNYLLKIGQNKLAEIIETNQQKYVFFNIFMSADSNFEYLQTTSKIGDLFKQKDRKQVYESEGQNSSQSDKKSQIVKDDQFYRISSKISTSMRKNSFNQGQMAFQERDFKQKNSLFDSIGPGLVSQYKMHNPISEIYTRSSSLQKSTFPFRENLSTSIDLLMRLELQSLNRRKKSCENARTYQKSMQKGQDIGLRERMGSKLRINLYNQEKVNQNLYFGNFESAVCNDREDTFYEARKKQSLSNRRLGIARSFFRQNQLQQKE